MLTQTIPCYPFQEYSDDDQIRSFFDMFNAASQQYLDWFNQTNLPYYPGLNGQLLQWVAAGLYGQPYFSALQADSIPAVGPLNTTELNTIPLNAFTPPSVTYYSVTDDVFKRIITWNFFKGDGRRFCPRWLKRRIMRFLLGVDGIDPEPWNPGFVVGCENTSPISVQFSGSVCEITISELVASALTQLTPNILSIFKAAFLAPDLLEKPIEFTYTVTIATTLNAIISPLSLSVSGASGTETTANATVTPLGGSGSYTYAWTWLSGGSGITIGSASAHVTDFSATGLTAGEVVTGVAQCVVTDTSTSDTATCALSVSLSRVTAPSVAPVPTSVNYAGGSANVTSPMVAAVVSGGGAPYSYHWTWSSGGAGIGIDSPNTYATTFTAIGLGVGTSDSGTAECTVTDSFGQTATCTLSITLSRSTMVGASISPNSLTIVTASLAGLTTGSTTVTANNGVPPYSYSWSWQSGGTNITINASSSASTTFTGTPPAYGVPVTGTAVCTVTDSAGQKAQETCAISITLETPIRLSISPGSLLSSGSATTQTTGSATVSASGGSGSYTYTWAWISGGGGISIDAQHSVSTTFTASGMTPGAALFGLAQCTVTDAFGQTNTIAIGVEIQCALSVYSGSLFSGNDIFLGTVGNGSIGYALSGIGSLAPTVISGGLSLVSITDNYFVPSKVATQPTYQSSSIAVSGFTSDPGQGWLLSVSANSVTRTGASASYTYSGGIATWRWTSPFQFSNGVSYPITINYV